MFNSLNSQRLAIFGLLLVSSVLAAPERQRRDAPSAWQHSVPQEYLLPNQEQYVILQEEYGVPQEQAPHSDYGVPHDTYGLPTTEQ